MRQRLWTGYAAVIATMWLLCAPICRSEQASPDFRFDIRPILSKNCFACHGPDEGHREAELRLDDREVAVELGAIVPGSPDDSELIRRITSDDPDERMPPAAAGHQLSDEEIILLNKWIAAGADYAKHWAYEPPQRPPLPSVSRPEWCRNAIDNFVLARLDQAGLAPEAEADRNRLIRRVSLDLIGLPPSVAEVDEFVYDSRPDAYERLVDRLLATTAYGEHWARMWLDLARYADTRGYEKDERRTIWPFRDWVIRALNADMPFDQFTVEQLAGDLLPGATREQTIATGFHRNTMQNDEGGTDDEEYRVAAVIDRVNTTMQVWMGTTMGCCQCHSHKYDPLSQREYYEMFAFLNQTSDADRYDQEPTLLTATEEQEKLKRTLDGELERVKREYDEQLKALTVAQREWEQAVVADVKWQLLKPREVVSTAGATCTILDDGSVIVSGTKPDFDTYTVRSTFPSPGPGEGPGEGKIVAVRLEAIPHDSLPNGGPGRAKDGGFVLSKMELFQEPIQPADHVKFVRVELPERHDYLTMSEVQVFRGEENIARVGTASQSSTAYEGHARLAIDGSTHPHFATGRSISHTAFDENPWWEVDLGEPTRVDRVVLWNENAHPYRMIGARVSLLAADRTPIWQKTLPFSPDLTTELTIDDATPQFVRAAADSERKEFPAQHAIEFHDRKQHGWSPRLRSAAPGDPRTTEQPRANGSQAIVFGLESPIDTKNANQLRIVLHQQTQIDDRKGQTLGHFRLLMTDDLHAAETATVPPAIREIARTPADERTPQQVEQIAAYFRSLRPQLKKLVAEREDIERRLTEEYKPDKMPIMVELPADKQRTTHVFHRGSFLNPGEVVTAGTPEVFSAFPDDLPRNRLGLARWLVARNNPLTARVVANRQWEQLFGTGIVLTSEDFGSQGMLPSHPQLLDWLAVELMENGWSLKQLTKTIVMSAAYRQSARTTEQKLAADPDNRLLSRGPRHRLSAEQIRDQALAVSGLLSNKLGGPSVMPPQPEGVWQVVYSDDRWRTSAGDDRYRRGLYTFWRRTSPYPSAMALDATSREVCTIRRISTNTPIAAFALLNDPVYVEAAQALARQIMQVQSQNIADHAMHAFRTVLARKPGPQEVERLDALFESELRHYTAHPEMAAKMSGVDSEAEKDLRRVAELAAWTVVSNVLLNLDETLNK